MAVSDKETIYESVYLALLLRMVNADYDDFVENEDLLKGEIKKAFQNEIKWMVIRLLEGLYGTDSFGLKCDMAKIALFGDKIPNDRLIILKFIWSNLSDYLGNNPEEFISSFRFPESK